MKFPLIGKIHYWTGIIPLTKFIFLSKILGAHGEAFKPKQIASQLSKHLDILEHFSPSLKPIHAS
jgi:hypothetical protein